MDPPIPLLMFFCEVPPPGVKRLTPEKANFSPKALRMSCDFELILH